MKAAITGWGVLSPLGTTREEFAESVRAGRGGIAPIERFDTSKYPSHLAAMLRAPIDYKRHIKPAHLRRMDDLSRQLTYVACEAFEHAGPAARDVPPERRAVVVASGMNHTESIEKFYISLLEEGPEGANPIYFPATIPNSAAGLIAIELECRGPNLTITQKETSAEAALVAAADLLENNEADVVLVAAGESLTPAVFDGLSELRTLSRGGAGRTEQMRPFSRGRNGFVTGEGSAAVVLERADDAEAAGRPTFGRLVGAAESSQLCSPVKYPVDPEPQAHAVEKLAATAECDPNDLAFFSAAANSTRSLDACEAETILLISDLLGWYGSELPVAALKASIGEVCAGGLTRILGALAGLDADLCPPLPFDAETYDGEFDLALSHRDAPVPVDGRSFLHLATAAGGQQMALWIAS